MKILFVCLQYIHAARWINQLKDSEHEIYVFDCLDRPIHEELKWTNYITGWKKRKLPRFKGEYYLSKKAPLIYSKIHPFLEVTASEKLRKIIQDINPDFVHSLEMQSQTYPLLNVRKKSSFKWGYSCWGNDIYYYQYFESQRIKKTLKSIDYFFLECNRDANLVKNYNSSSQILSTSFPGGGGYNLERYNKFKTPVDERNLIILKGYEHKFGRALNTLSALEKLIPMINNYKIYVYSAHDSVVGKINEMNSKYGLSIEYSTRYNQISHEELLSKFGKAKIAIGNNISDGVPNTLLEAIILGAFPIQSNPGGASEDYVTHNSNGFLIEDAENVEEIAMHIRNALQNDSLLANAFDLNKEIAKTLDYDTIKERVLSAYKRIASEL